MKRIFWFPIIPGITRETLNINLGGHKGPGVPDASAIWIQDWFWFVQTRSIFIDGMLTSVTASCWHSELCDSFKTNCSLAAVRRIVETPGAGGDTFVMLWQKHTNHINILEVSIFVCLQDKWFSRLDIRKRLLFWKWTSQYFGWLRKCAIYIYFDWYHG